MKSAIFSFILVCLLSLSAFAQGETKKTEAYKVDEIGIERNSEDIQMQIEIVRDELKKNPKSKAVIYNYGKVKDVARRARDISKYSFFNNIEESRLKVLYEGDYPFPLTEFWIVPEGAIEPKPKTATLFADFVKMTNKQMSAKITDYFAKLCEDNYLKGVINVFGNAKYIRQMRKQIEKNSPRHCCYDGPRVVFFTAASKELKTEFWILKK
jgi:hypothetical protein